MLSATCCGGRGPAQIRLNCPSLATSRPVLADLGEQLAEADHVFPPARGSLTVLDLSVAPSDYSSRGFGERRSL